MSDLKGKTVAITGASRGIGEAAARRFAEHGANVVLLARSGDDIARIAAKIGDHALAIPCDVADADGLKAAIDKAALHFGGLDVLINNAGLLEPIGRIANLAPADFARVIDVNVSGVFNGIAAALPHMKNGGSILTIGSGAATSVLEGWSHYCASKAAVHHLNACLDAEMRGQGIRAIVLSPGTVATEMQRVIKASGLNPVSTLEWEDHIPPEWPAEALVWMCSTDADRYCGQVVSLRESGLRQAIGLS